MRGCARRESRCSQEGRYFSDDHRSFSFSYLSTGVYVEQLLSWSEFFSPEQMPMLKSEDFFESTRETLELVLDFLGLPEWGTRSLGGPQ